jgi:ABC-2 type transport system ATP-binding protein
MPVLTATGAGVRHRRRWLFRDLDITAEPGDIVAVTGVPGSGRTTVLLALAKRFRLSAGQVDLAGVAALGHVPDVTQPEPVLTVAEHVRERLALLGRPSREAGAVELYGLDPALKGWQLTPLQKQLLGIALARLARPAVIALDGMDDGLNTAESETLWQAIAGLAADGIAFVVTAREADPERVTTVVTLGDPQTPPTTDAKGPAEVRAAEAAPEADEPTEAQAEKPEPDVNEPEAEAREVEEPEAEAREVEEPEVDERDEKAGAESAGPGEQR